MRINLNIPAPEEGDKNLEQFTFVKRGYDPEEVDKYVATLEQVIKSYKDKDNAIKNAIISAQIAADNMIKNAKAQADEYKAQIGRELGKVRSEVERQRMRVQAFQDVYTNLVRKYLIEVQDNDMSDLYSRLDDVDKLLGVLMEDDILTQSASDESSTESYIPEPPAYEDLK